MCVALVSFYPRGHEMGRNFSERNENKRALMDERMGNGEVGCFQDQIVEVKDIDVDRAWAFVNGLAAAHRAFDALCRAEEFGDEELRARLDDHIEEFRLIEDVGGLSFDDAAPADDLDMFKVEESDGLFERSFPVAEIGAESEVDSGQNRFCCAVGGGGILKYSKARRVATRPRGVRSRNPCCIR